MSAERNAIESMDCSQETENLDWGKNIMDISRGAD